MWLTGLRRNSSLEGSVCSSWTGNMAVHHLAVCIHVMKLKPVGKALLSWDCASTIWWMDVPVVMIPALFFLSLENIVIMLWQAVSCSHSLLWSVGFLQTLVVVFQNLPLWWQLNLAAELSIKSIWLYCLAPLQPLAEWKENRHQSLFLVRGLLSKCGGMLALMARQLGLWHLLRRNHFKVISHLVTRMCWHPYISLCVCQEWRSESAKKKKKRKPDSSDQHRDAAGDILYMRSLCIAQKVRELLLCWWKAFPPALF